MLPSPPPKGSRVKVVRRTLADGSVKEYRYDRETKQRLDAEAPRRRYKAPTPPTGLLALTAAYQRSPEFRALSLRTQDNHEREIAWLEKLGDIDPKAIRRSHLLGLRDMIAIKRGPGSANVFLSVMSTLFSWAVEREHVEMNPATGAKRLEGGELPPWTEEEARLAMTPGKLPEAIRRAVVLAYYTTQRRGDLCAMTWAAYDGACIRLTQQKTGVILVLPVEEALRAELDAWKAENRASAKPAVHILTSSRGPWTPNGLSHAIQRELATLEGVRSGLNIHGLRKLSAARLADAGCSAHEIMARTGHRTLAMAQHYTKAADQERLAGAAIHRLEKMAGKRG